MRKRVTLITGANGEIGHGLISALYKQRNDAIIALDLHPVFTKHRTGLLNTVGLHVQNNSPTTPPLARVSGNLGSE